MRVFVEVLVVDEGSFSSIAAIEVGTISKAPSFPSLTAFFKTVSFRSIATTSLNFRTKRTITLPFLLKKTEMYEFVSTNPDYH